MSNFERMGLNIHVYFGTSFISLLDMAGVQVLRRSKCPMLKPLALMRKYKNIIFNLFDRFSLTSI